MSERRGNPEELLNKLKEDLEFCEESLRREIRVELAIKILNEVLYYFKRLSKERLTVEQIAQASRLSARARLLYHRAVALQALREKEAAER